MARAYLKLLVPTQVIVCFLSHNGEGDIDLYDCQYENN